MNRASPRHGRARLRDSGAGRRIGDRLTAPPWCKWRSTPMSWNHSGACVPFCTFLVNTWAVHTLPGKRTSARRHRA